MYSSSAKPRTRDMSSRYAASAAHVDSGLDPVARPSTASGLAVTSRAMRYAARRPPARSSGTMMTSATLPPLPRVAGDADQGGAERRHRHAARHEPHPRREMLACQERARRALRDERRPQCDQQRVAQGADPTTNDDRVDVHRQDEDPYGGGDRGDEAAAHVPRRLVAGVRGREQRPYGLRVRGGPHPGEGGAGRVQLEAAALAARALRAVGDRDVADLPGDAACPAPQLTVDDQAGGQAGAEVEVGHGAHLITERVAAARR